VAVATTPTLQTGAASTPNALSEPQKQNVLDFLPSL